MISQEGFKDVNFDMSIDLEEMWMGANSFYSQ